MCVCASLRERRERESLSWGLPRMFLASCARRASEHPCSVQIIRHACDRRLMLHRNSQVQQTLFREMFTCCGHSRTACDRSALKPWVAAASMINDCQFVLGIVSLTPYRRDFESLSRLFDRCAEQSVCGLFLRPQDGPALSCPFLLADLSNFRLQTVSVREDRFCVVHTQAATVVTG